MPIQVLPAARSFSSQLGEKIGTGLGEGVEAIFSKRLQKKEDEKRYKAVSERFGPEIAALPPEIQMAYIKEQLKNEGKAKLKESERDFVSNLFGGKDQEKQGMGDQLSGMGQERTETSSNELAQQEMTTGFDASKLTDEQILQATATNPKLGDALARARDLAERKKEKSPEFKREQEITKGQAKADVKYNEQLQEASKQHELKERTLNRLETLNKKGVTGKPYEKLAERFGLVNLTSEGRREFAADVKNLITDIRSILGAQFTGFEFQTILNAYPSADFSQKANEAIIRNLKEFQNIKHKEVQFAEQLKRDNKGKIPPDFQAKVNEKVREYASSKLGEIKENTRQIINEEYRIQPGNTLMFDPEGNEMSVPEKDVSRLLELGASLP